MTQGKKEKTKLEDLLYQFSTEINVGKDNWHLKRTINLIEEHLNEKPEELKKFEENSSDGALQILLKEVYPSHHVFTKSRIRELDIEKLLRDCILLFIKKGVNIDHTDVEGNTVLHLLASSPWKNSYLINYLFQKAESKPKSVQNNEGDTPLHLAIAKRNIPALQALTCCAAENKTDAFDVLNKDGNPPLHAAVKLGNKRILKELVISVNAWYGENSEKTLKILNTLNKDGFSPLDLVFTKCPQLSTEECYKILSEAGAKLSRIKDLDSSSFSFLPHPPRVAASTKFFQRLRLNRVPPPRVAASTPKSTVVTPSPQPSVVTPAPRPATQPKGLDVGMPRSQKPDDDSVDDLAGLDDLSLNRR